MLNMARPRLMDFYAQLGHHLQSRLLLSDSEHLDNETNGYDDIDLQCEEHDDAHDIETAFQHIYFVMLFMACLWFIGKVFARCGLPSLVGEIVCGIILGPNLLGFVPYSDALIVIGEIGLVLLVLEAGIDVSIGHLKVVGYRGLSVAVFGSMIPLGIGTGLAVLYGNELQSAFAIGACLAPTSMGIALNVLRNAKVLNTPTGQLIIAAAVLDDVIALMLLSELEAIADPTIGKILLPLIVSPAFIVFFGFLAVKVTPWLIQKIMIKTHKHQHENVILLLLFLATFALIPVCFYAGSSHLLGAFLAGLMFCTDHTIHEAWNNQIKRIMQWMLRVFFACTIGFAVPIQDFWTKPVLIGGLLYFVAIIGKILTGIFAKPLIGSEFFTIAFSMSAWGEFAFILATASYDTGSIDKDSYSSVLMAVLLSVVISPLCLRGTLVIASKQKEKRLTGARSAHYDYNDHHAGDTEIHPVYFCVHTKGKGRWGHQDKLLHCIFNLNLEIMDFRAFNESEYNYTHHLPIVQDVFYVLDTTLSLPPTKRLDKVQERKLQQRYKEIKRSIKETMADPLAVIDVMRWLPGVRRNDDINSPVKGQKKKRKTVSYCRKEAYKQARLALDNVEVARSSSYLVSGISRIRPTHDALHRDKFTYHGGIHTEQDDLIAMAFIDTLQSLQASLSPPNRSSPTGSTDKQPLNTEELFEKIETLRSCVEQLPIFQQALSDDGREMISNPPSVHSIDAMGHNTSIPKSFDAHYAQTFAPLHPNISNSTDDKDTKDSKEGVDGGNTQNNTDNTVAMKHLRRKLSEHGSILGIMHNKPSSSSTTKIPLKPPYIIPPQPGMFLSHSHGILPGTHSHAHAHASHHGHSKFFDHLPRDLFTGYHPHLPSQTHSSDHNPHVSSTESSHSSIKSDDMHCDTMYGDEDEHHRPLTMYTNLDDLDEEDIDEDEDEYDNDNDNDGSQEVPEPMELTKARTVRLKNGRDGKKAPKRALKRSTTWSKKLFQSLHKKLSDDDESDNGRSAKKEKKKKRKKKKKERTKSKDELSSSSAHKAMNWIDDEPIAVDPKMLEIPKALLNKSHKTVFYDDDGNVNESENEDDNANGSPHETQPLKSSK